MIDEINFRRKSPGGGGGYSLIRGYWGCAAGWGRIFTTGLTIKGRIFNRVARMGSHIFGFLGVRRFFTFMVSKRTRMFEL